VEKKIFGKVKKVAEVNPALCKGCGTCTATCRPNAIDLYGFSNQEITDVVSGIIAERRKVDDLNSAESLVKGF
jgi:heterodisulfide reductase subunit A